MEQSAADEIVEEFDVLIGESIANPHGRVESVQTLRYNFKPESLLAQPGVMETTNERGVTVRFPSLDTVCFDDQRSPGIH